VKVHPPVRDRLAGLLLALSIQALLTALLLSAHNPAAPVVDSRELIFALPPLPKMLTPKPNAPALPRPRAPSIPTLMPPAVPPPAALPSGPITVLPMPDDLRRFGQALNNCALEHYADLSAEAKSHCPDPGEGVVVRQTPDLMGHPSQTKDEAYWEEEWARENTPLRAPCMGMTEIKSGNGRTAVPVPMVDTFCILMMLATGHGRELVDPHLWPHYEKENLPKEELYKVEKAYDAWNKKYGKAPGGKDPLSAKGVGVHAQ
jgi:hypothetical protein